MTFFGKSDVFFICMLRPLSFNIKIQESEIEAARVNQFLQIMYNATLFFIPFFFEKWQRHRFLNVEIKYINGKRSRKYLLLSSHKCPHPNTCKTNLGIIPIISPFNNGSLVVHISCKIIV